MHVCLYMVIGMCMWVRMPLYTHAYRAPRWTLVSASVASHLTYWGRVPQLNPKLTSVASLASQLVPRAPVSALELQVAHHAHPTLRGARNPGSGPLPSVVSTLITEFSLQLQTEQIRVENFLFSPWTHLHLFTHSGWIIKHNSSPKEPIALLASLAARHTHGAQKYVQKKHHMY